MIRNSILLRFINAQKLMCSPASRCSSTVNFASASTVEYDEVERHKKLAKEWWDPLGPLKALHEMNHLRVPFICNGLVNSGRIEEENLYKPKSLKGVEILDVGCGGGILSVPLSRLGGSVTGLDPSNDLIEVAKKQTEIEPDISVPPTFIASSIEDHAVENANKYDAVVLSEVIEHVTKKQEFLDACSAVLKPGGSMFVTTISKTNISWMLAKVAAEYFLCLLPAGTHEWNKFISPNELAVLLERAGCQTKLVNGMMYVPLQFKWYWVPETSVNYALHAIKVVGMEAEE